MLGDAMADWLAYGLEDAYAEQPEMGVTRRHRTVSGLIKYQPKGDPADWAAAAKASSLPEKRTPLSSCSDSMTVLRSASRRLRNPTASRRIIRPTRRMPKPKRTPSPQSPGR